MKRSTAVRHLVEMAEVATDHLRFRASDIGWPLEELWVAGALLGPDAEIEHGTVVLMIDEPPDELPWLAPHPAAEDVADRLRLGKRPVSWRYRPMDWPPWTYQDRRVARFWSATDGVDDAVIDALRSAETVDMIEPTGTEFVQQLGVELEVSRRHLRAILDRYWDDKWRRSNRWLSSPEDQLWRAATAITEIEAALAEDDA